MKSPRRRWFRFGLRTLFVAVTIVSVPIGWLTYQLHWIGQRREMYRQAKQGLADMFIGFPEPIIDGGFSGASSWRKWLGDEPRSIIGMPWPESDPRWERTRLLFPEARLIYFEPPAAELPDNLDDWP